MTYRGYMRTGGEKREDIGGVGVEGAKGKATELGCDRRSDWVFGKWMKVRSGAARFLIVK
jgi:hypothetical protein